MDEIEELLTDIAKWLELPFTLPSLPLEDRKAFPKCAAIYFVIKGKKILYIGKTTSLWKRWIAHHRQSQLEKIKEVRIAWIKVRSRKSLSAAESALIQFFKPVLNNSKCEVKRKRKAKKSKPLS